MTWTATILGNLPSMKNRRIPVMRGGKLRIIKNAQAQQWVEDAKKQLAFLRTWPLLAGNVELEVVVYYRSRRSDLDIELLKDVLQGYVYENDRQIVRMWARKRVDAKNPRCEVTVWPDGG